IGRADLPAPVRRPADLLGPAVSRVALAAPSCPLGGYTRAYLEGLGLYEALVARAVLVDHSRAVVAAVQAGEAAAGLVYSSATAACGVLFRVRRLPAPIRYAGAVARHARQPEQARAFLAFLTSAPARRRFRSCGFLLVGETPRPTALTARRWVARRGPRPCLARRWPPGSARRRRHAPRRGWRSPSPASSSRTGAGRRGCMRRRT